MKIINELKQLALKNGIKQESLARDLGVTFATLNRWFNGKAVPRNKAVFKVESYIRGFQIEKHVDYIKYIETVNNPSLFDCGVLSENELKVISKIIKKDKNVHAYLFDLVTLIPEFGRNFDWNTGSILQHFDPEIVINTLKKN